MTKSTATAMPPLESADRELVEQCLAGDAKAFGRIVERYQALVCALAFSACGDVHRSEDIAQESFIIAWRQLRDLREPAKLRSWICGIVRNVANSALRKDGRTPVAQAKELDEDSIGPGESATPADHAISREEEAIVLRQLRELPSLYREPMVLFYRQHESVTAVAEALGISEDAAKQRLARGRTMLAERVERSLGAVLRTTAPTAAFTLAVMGALAATTTRATAAVATGTGAKMMKGTAAGGAAAVSFIGALVGLLSMIQSQTQNARTPRERRFAVWALALAAAVGLATGFALGMRGIRMIVTSPYLGAFSFLAGVLFSLASFGFSFWFYRRRERIRTEDGLNPLSARSVWRCEPGQRGFFQAVIGMAVSMGSVINIPHLLVPLADGRIAVKPLVGVPLVLSGLAAWAILLRPHEYRRILMALLCLLWLQFLALAVFFWHRWSQSGEWNQFIAVIAIQFFNIGIWLASAIGIYLYWRREKWGRNPTRGPEA